MRLGKDEVVVCEGIHALNDDIAAYCPDAFRLYISARSVVVDGDGQEIFKGTWMRLLRRLVRDSNFRGTPAAATLDMWANVRRGEKRFISPFKERANLMFDSSFPCEVSIMKNFAAPLLAAVPEGAERYTEIRASCRRSIASRRSTPPCSRPRACCASSSAAACTATERAAPSALPAGEPEGAFQAFPLRGRLRVRVGHTPCH